MVTKATVNYLAYYLSLTEAEVRDRLRDVSDRTRPFYLDCRAIALSPFLFEATPFVKQRALRLKLVSQEELDAAFERSRDREADEAARLAEAERREGC